MRVLLGRRILPVTLAKFRMEGLEAPEAMEDYEQQEELPLAECSYKRHVQAKGTGRMAQKRLTCRIPSSANKALTDLMVDLDKRRGKTLVHVMELALKSPAHPLREFPGEGEVVCTLNVSDEWLRLFKQYRKDNEVPENTALFRNAVLRGLSIKLDGGRSPTSNSRKATGKGRQR